METKQQKLRQYHLNRISKDIGEERLKRYRDSVKQYKQNRTFQNNERKFYQIDGGFTWTCEQPDAKEKKN